MRKKLLQAMLLILPASLFIASCQKEIKERSYTNDKPEEMTIDSMHGHLTQTKTFSAEVVIKWLDMQTRILKMGPGQNLYGLNSARYLAYCGTAVYESVVPGMPAYQSLSGQLTNMPAMPVTVPGKAYHWAASANAALAFMSKSFFSFTTDANKTSMDSLENALNIEYQAEVSAETFQRSVNFGKSVSQLVYAWSKTDGSLTVNPPYIPPVGPGLWTPTPPNFPSAAAPYWGNNRLLVQGSLNNSAPVPPPAYSTDPSSPYYAMVRDVYDISQNLTADQIAIAYYYRDAPGYLAGAHYIPIFKQVLQKAQPSLEIAAMVYAKTGISAADAITGCWKIKYLYNIERPIRYIREVLGHTTWNPLFNTPGHPDFPSGHSTLAGAVEQSLTSVFGENFHFTNDTYAYLGMAPRSYDSFSEMADEIGRSRVFAGIHYAYSCVNGREQGKTIARNIQEKLRFLKD